jgi:hypothetical protein
MIIGNKEIAIIGLLHFYKILHGPEIIPEVKVARRPDSAYNCLHKIYFAAKGI